MKGVVGAGAEIADTNVVFNMGVEAAGASGSGSVAAKIRWRLPGSSSTRCRRCRLWGWGLLESNFADELLEGGDGGGVEVRDNYSSRRRRC